MYTHKEVAKIIGVLGFQKRRRAKGTVIMRNDTTVKRLKQQYGIDEISAEVQEKRHSTGSPIFAVET